MNKKVLIFALVLVLAVGFVFAAKADMKVGAQMGYDGRTLVEKTEKYGTYKYVNNCFYGAFTFEYGVTDAISVKAEAGINTKGNLLEKKATGDINDSLGTTPVNFTLYAGAMYNHAINKDFTVYGGAGLDMLIGKVDVKDKKTSLGAGIGLEAGISYKINNQFSVNAGAKFAWHFINSGKFRCLEPTSKISQLTYKAYAGVTYSL